MASISRDPGGCKRILFFDLNGNRQPIRLGKASMASAMTVKLRVERIMEAKRLGRAMDADTAQWVADLEGDLPDKLAAVGLIPTREKAAAATLETFVESYIVRRADASPHTRRIWRQTKRRLVEHFGADKPLAEITRGEAADWRLTLVGEGLADASVRKHCGFAKHFFAQAVDHELIPVNPFAKLVSAPVGNDARQFFVTREATQKIIDAAPDAQWRLIIALSRYGGLRCPSEHLALKWEDVDWAANRIRVKSPKTKKHAGHESRLVPLFPELRPYLEDAAEIAEKGTEYVVTRYRDTTDSAVRRQLARIIRRAGLTPWPRITHNLRASRATELAAEYPAHVAAAWLGHSTLVASKHYWQVTEADFDRAVQGSAQRGAKCGALGAQNEAQHPIAEIRPRSQEERAARSARCYEHVSCADSCESELAAATGGKKSMAEVHGNRTHRTHAVRASRRF